MLIETHRMNYIDTLITVNEQQWNSKYLEYCRISRLVATLHKHVSPPGMSWLPRHVPALPVWPAPLQPLRSRHSHHHTPPTHVGPSVHPTCDTCEQAGCPRWHAAPAYPVAAEASSLLQQQQPPCHCSTRQQTAACCHSRRSHSCCCCCHCCCSHQQCWLLAAAAAAHVLLRHTWRGVTGVAGPAVAPHPTRP